MIEETDNFIKSSCPNVQKIGLMSTTGTRKVEIYNQELKSFGFEITEVPDNMQN